MSQSLTRAVRLLLWLAQESEPGADGRRLGEISAGVGLDKATAHRLLQTLVKVDFVRQDETTRLYSLGSSALLLAGAARAAHPFLARCAPIADALAKELNETVSLSERRGLDNVTIYEIESQQVVRYANKIGRSSRLHVAAGAQAVLAWSPDPVIDEILAGPLEPYTPRTVTDPDQLRKIIDRALRSGYTHSFGQRHEGVHSLAVPIRDEDGIALGAASIIWPSRGRDEDRRRLREWPPLLLRAFARSADEGRRDA